MLRPGANWKGLLVLGLEILEGQREMGWREKDWIDRDRERERGQRERERTGRETEKQVKREGVLVGGGVVVCVLGAPCCSLWVCLPPPPSHLLLQTAPQKVGCGNWQCRQELGTL